MKRILINPRPFWQASCKEYGLNVNAAGGAYWREDAAYCFSLQEIEQDLEKPAEELHDMCLQVIDKLIIDPIYLKRLNIPENLWDFLLRSWYHKEPSLYGRFDFVYDGTSPAKMLEYNADTPTSLFESAVFQWFWLEENIKRGELKFDIDQFNSIHDKLVLNFKKFASNPLYFAGLLKEDDDRLTLEYLADCAKQAGLDTKIIEMQNIGILNKQFVDLQDQKIVSLFKLYAWEWMVQEEFAEFLPKSLTKFIEPPWKMLLSTKAILPELWKAYPNHPNLLEAYHDDEKHSMRNYVQKPIFSREGANINLFKNGVIKDKTTGLYGNHATISQSFHAVNSFDGHIPTLGVWMVGNEAAGLGIRESKKIITTSDACFIPHYIEQ